MAQNSPLTVRVNYEEYGNSNRHINDPQMKKSLLAKALLLACIGALTTSSTWAAFVTWDLNPGNVNAPVGSATQLYTVSGFSITARGFDNVAGTDTPHDLFYKFQTPVNGAGERGLGVVGTNDNELQINNDGSPAQYIQLDLRSILSQGFTGGEIMVGSIQAGESFRLYGSNSQGTLGIQLGGLFGSTFDEKFVAIPSFGSFQFVSVAAGVMDILPVAFRATPVPEMNALFPIVGLVAAVSSTHVLRRRRATRLNALGA